ncbi:MAG: hypothetical protein LBB85_04290 [Dysgonamonadaceae bacterium]|jgi:hypothetical protein|nr:hypothetical protein [Dysgonamonadaceae bacterium]
MFAKNKKNASIYDVTDTAMNDFLNLNETVPAVVRIAQSLAQENSNARYTPAHLTKVLSPKDSVLYKTVYQSEIEKHKYCF